MRSILIFLSLLLSLVSGCSYTLLDSSRSPSTLIVPFIDGDRGGELTRALVKELSQSTQFRPSSSGRYKLDVELVDFKDQNVGFRYDQNSEGELLTTLIPSETRTSMLVEISVIDTYRGCLFFGPARVSGSVTFDHDWYTSHGAVNVFSLGQVTDYFDAKDGIYPPLAKKMAKKIVDLLDQIAP